MPTNVGQLGRSGQEGGGGAELVQPEDENIVMVLAGLGEEEDSYNVEIVASREDKMNVYQDRTLWLGRGWGPYLVLVQAMHTMLSAAAASLLCHGCLQLCLV